MSKQYHSSKELGDALIKAALETDNVGLIENFKTLADVPVGFSGLAPPIPCTSAELTTFRQNILATTEVAHPVGTRYKLTDGLLIGKIVEWNGEAFSPNASLIYSRYNLNGLNKRIQGGTSLLDQAYDVPSTFVIDIPGFLMSPTSKVEIVMDAYSNIVTAVSRDYQINTRQTSGDATTYNGANKTSSTTAAGYRMYHEFSNASSLGAQYSWGFPDGFGSSSWTQNSEGLLNTAINWQIFFRHRQGVSTLATIATTSGVTAVTGTAFSTIANGSTGTWCNKYLWGYVAGVPTLLGQVTTTTPTATALTLTANAAISYSGNLYATDTNVAPYQSIVGVSVKVFP